MEVMHTLRQSYSNCFIVVFFGSSLLVHILGSGGEVDVYFGQHLLLLLQLDIVGRMVIECQLASMFIIAPRTFIDVPWTHMGI